MAELRRSGLSLAHPDPADPISELGARAILSSTFDLSLKALRGALAPDRERLATALAALGYAPLAEFGRSFGRAIAGLDETDFERRVIAAGDLFLVEHGQERGRFRLHPLLAELLRPRAEAGPVVDRMTEWFLARLPKCPSEKG